MINKANSFKLEEIDVSPIAAPKTLGGTLLQLKKLMEAKSDTKINEPKVEENIMD